MQRVERVVCVERWSPRAIDGSSGSYAAMSSYQVMKLI